jgi:hypothetical protein
MVFVNSVVVEECLELPHLEQAAAPKAQTYQAVAFQGVATIAGSSSFQGAASSFREAVIRGESLVAFLDGPMAA